MSTSPLRGISRRVVTLVATLALLLGLAPAAAAATRPTNATGLTTHACAFPVLGDHTVAAELGVRDDGASTEFDVRVSDRSGFGMLFALLAVSELRMNGTFVTTWTTTSGMSVSVPLPFTFPPNRGPFTTSTTVVLDGQGVVPAPLIGQDIAAVRVDELRLSMAVDHADGSEMTLEPIGSPPDFDGNPATVSIPCVLDPAGQPRTLVNAAIDRTPPSVPGNVRLQTGELSWTAASDNVGVAEYEVIYLMNGITQVTGRTSNLRFPYAMSCGEYTLGVRAVDAAGNRSETVAASHTVACDPPQPPTDLRVVGTADPTNTRLDWNGVATSHHQYEVSWPGGSARTIYQGATSTYFLSELPPATRVCVQVVAIDRIGQRSAPSELCFTTLDGPPTMPTGLRAVDKTMDMATVRWNRSYGNIAYYEVYYSHAGIALERTASATAEPSFRAVNEYSGRYFTFKVRAIDTRGRPSAWTDWFEFSLLDPPAVVTSDITGTLTAPSLFSGPAAITGSTSFTPDWRNYPTPSAEISDFTVRTGRVKLPAVGGIPITGSIVLIGSPGQLDLNYYDQRASGTVRTRLRVADPKLFGAIPLMGSNCQTRKLSPIALASPNTFAYGATSTLNSSFELSDLSGCGALNGMLSPLTASSGNQLSMQLEPRVKFT